MVLTRFSFGFVIYTNLFNLQLISSFTCLIKPLCIFTSSEQIKGQINIYYVVGGLQM